MKLEKGKSTVEQYFSRSASFVSKNIDICNYAINQLFMTIGQVFTMVSQDFDGILRPLCQQDANIVLIRLKKQ